MSAPADPTSAFIPTATPPALRARRCSRHTAREAVARCPSCSGYFCRECVVEHEGLLICASCLARQVAGAAAASGRRGKGLARFRQAASLGFSLLLLWGLFYWFGSILLRIPAEVHDGTVWKKNLQPDQDEVRD